MVEIVASLKVPLYFSRAAVPLISPWNDRWSENVQESPSSQPYFSPRPTWLWSPPQAPWCLPWSSRATCPSNRTPRRSIKFWYRNISSFYLSMKVCEYSLFSALDEVLYFVLQPPPKSRTNVFPGPVWLQGDVVYQGGQQHQGLPDLLCYFSPLELHGNQLVGGHYWFSIIPPRFPTNKGVK